MPVPRPSDEAPAPRRLLRDVVYDKMYEAILDGTLELGERLNDDELVRWLGVSRTPVREAIAKLGEQGLVDIEANRYTRIVKPSFENFLDTVRSGYSVWALFVKRGVPLLSDSDRAFVVKGLEKRAADFAAKRPEDLANLVAVNDRLLEAAASPTLTRIWGSTGPMTLFVFRRAGANGVFPYEPGAEFSAKLAEAVKKNDADEAWRLVDTQPDRFDAYYDEVRALGIYPPQ
ncbi:putative HTH-type transcriptional regulator [Frondihabitans sp. 762G35]|uniref:GntR family transcriptional regulator n=1 Tax=Frondihabitans sp. 762G35 TaxID=1446794 RepID=UPI000D21EB3C|nr:GntR family transcriptional regulator [Frondihabitans sp. 762G35]ARC55577.1 putative HTH-type transcriptional regulator [Frondihabitans sp. 762G35]